MQPNLTERLSGALSVGMTGNDIVEPLGRLLRLLDSPSEITLLSAQFERELYYRLLAGPIGARLGQIGRHNARFSQIRKAAEWISANSN